MRVYVCASFTHLLPEEMLAGLLSALESMDPSRCVTFTPVALNYVSAQPTNLKLEHVGEGKGQAVVHWERFVNVQDNENTAI